MQVESSLLKSGFLPDTVCTTLNAEYSDLEDCLGQISKLLATNTFKSDLSNLKIYTKFDLLSPSELERAMLLYSYLGHAYVWGEASTPSSIPENIAKPWVEISKLLKRPPILSYASYALNNWAPVDEDKEELEPENIVILQNFFGGIDEDWFIMIHVAIEFEAKNLLQSLGQFFLSDEKEEFLEEALISIKKINKILNRMPDRCDPYIYYNRVRPYIFGWKNNPATSNGIIYEGVEEFSNEPKFFRGETGAQSSIVPAVDALLGINHSEDPLRIYLDEMRDYMPFEHRQLLNNLDKWSNQENIKKKRKNIAKSSLNLLDEIVFEVKEFRSTHLSLARDYIHTQSKEVKTNSNSVGTGGTPFMQYLEKHLDETVSNG